MYIYIYIYIYIFLAPKINYKSIIANVSPQWLFVPKYKIIITKYNVHNSNTDVMGIYILILKQW